MKRIINCESCNKPMGEIRDATLRAGMVVLCSTCLAPKPNRQDTIFTDKDTVIDRVRKILAGLA